MVWTNNAQKSKSSEFFKGFNIFDKLNNSMFGKVIKTITNHLSKDEIKQFTLPKVVVIGNESTGKSSLLENITKCQIFPRDNKLCTKCPIHVKLNNGVTNYSISYFADDSEQINKIIDNKNDIYKEVKTILDNISADDISENEITINITDSDVPVFEFYDLPGIRTYPPEAAEITTNMYSQYHLFLYLHKYKNK